MNHLYYGDNLTIMQQRMLKDSVDLIYLDPPFNSKRSYNMMYATMTGKPVPEQADAFCDTWELDAEKEELGKAMPALMREHGVDQYYVKFWRLWIDALKNTQPHLLAYLIYMVERLLHMKSILKSNGSLYLHCDPTASHYIKVMLDGIFGHRNFRNEIIWQRTSSHNDTKRWGAVHDTIFFYSKGDKFTWNPVYTAHDEKYVEQFYRHEDKRGRYRLDHIIRSASMGPRPNLAYEYKGFTPQWGWRVMREKLEALDKDNRLEWSKTGRPYLKRYLHEQKGTAIKSVITDINPIGAVAAERLGYPTQKPIALLDRILQASSNEGDLIFDPFCGCGTTIYSAEKNRRRWIGCDIAILSIQLVTDILQKRYRLVNGKHFEVDGVPVSVEQARVLFERSPSQFQHWVVERVGGFPTQKKVADLGIDGRIYFETKDDLKDMVLSVKGGHIKPSDIRDLRGVLAREDSSEMAGFLSLESPTKAMREEAGRAGVYKYSDVSYDRIQLLTVQQILEEKRHFNTPSRLGSRAASGQGSLLP